MENKFCHAYVRDKKEICQFIQWISYGPYNHVGGIVLAKDGKCYVVGIELIVFDCNNDIEIN